MGKKRQKLDELIRVYEDLEETLKALRASAERHAESSLKQINIKKLVSQLTRSKKRIERKIGSAFLLEKDYLLKRWKSFTSHADEKR